MPEIYRAWIGTIVRHSLSGLSIYLTAHGWLTSGQADQFLAVIATGAAAILWSLWQKYRQKLKQFTAQELPAGVTSAQVNEVIAETPAADNRAKVLETTT